LANKVVVAVVVAVAVAVAATVAVAVAFVAIAIVHIVSRDVDVLGSDTLLVQINNKATLAGVPGSYRPSSI